MVLLGALEFPGESRASGQSPGATPRWLERSLATTRRVVALGMCNACRMHEEIRALSLEAIKEQILNKLGMKQAPNMTGRALPRIPPISKLMDMYGMQADQPLGHEPKITHHEEVDESVARTDVVIALAQPPASVSGAHCTTNAILALAYNIPVLARSNSQRADCSSGNDLYNNCHSLTCKVAAPPYRPPVESLSPKHSSYSSKSRNNSTTHTNRTIALIRNNALLRSTCSITITTINKELKRWTYGSKKLNGRVDPLNTKITSVYTCNDHPAGFTRMDARGEKDAGRPRVLQAILRDLFTFASELKTEQSGRFGHSRGVLGQQWRFAPYTSVTHGTVSISYYPRLRHSKGSLEVLYFKFSDKVVQHRVTHADLSLWIYGSQENRDETENDGLLSLQDYDADSGGGGGGFSQGPSEGTVVITLQRVMRGPTDTSNPQLGPALTTKYQRPVGRRGMWVTIPIKRMVAEWFRHPRDNLGVAIKIQIQNGRKVAKGNRLVATNPDLDIGPFLEVRTQLDTRRGSRIKRNVGLNCDEASQETRCCRYKLTVDFEKFGWDWIIAPKKCLRKCCLIGYFCMSYYMYCLFTFFMLIARYRIRSK
ncbi:unnamed protein product [Trichogramma brassicae]|uniref:TGF-beta family profile domain-containing protein n=1 Tax=Trichogramma brassicae TaxID=86971 RepID=A0A6H5I9K3_9HYME|nr:unnamed protein product [Trichogramma brassicae]